MRGKKLRRILIPAMAIFLALNLTVTAGMLSSAAELDNYFGRGKKTVTTLNGLSHWNTDYYPRLYKNAKESRAAAAEVSERISDGGIVLLKNSGLLPLRADTTISPLGLRYVAPYYGGKGSSTVDPGEDYVVTPQEGLHDVFPAVNTLMEDTLAQALNGGPELKTNSNVVAAVPLEGGSDEAALYEFRPELYTPLGESCRGTVGLVFVGRQTGEDLDAYPGVYSDGTPHMLALTDAERAAIQFAKSNCAGVVVVLACSAPMELTELEDDENVDAILWIGGAGATGYASLGSILAGDVIPSGRTSDIYPCDFTRDPTYPNFDDGSNAFLYSNAPTTLAANLADEVYGPAAFHEYEEGVYLGYKYYETSYDIGCLADYHDRAKGVLYPFGYGLSYTSFTQKLLTFSDWGDKICLTVRVTNTGAAYAGRDVVQIYFTPPYTEFDRAHGLEKPTVSLAAFGKTGEIAPGGYEDVSLAFLKEDMASYCTTRSNGDGTTGAYLLEEGEYTISLRANSHQVLDSRPVSIPADIWYDYTNPRQSERDTQAASNRFEQLDAYMTNTSISGSTTLTRRDWAGTQPTAPTAGDAMASPTVVEWIAKADTMRYDSSLDDTLGDKPGSPLYRAEMPTTGADNGLVLADLRGKDYDDPLWNALLDQLSPNDAEALRLCLFEVGYQTGAVDSIGKPETVEHDGPQGLTLSDQAGHNWLNGTCAYPSAPIMAATWDRELMYDFGYMVGQEALVAGINGWYAPGLNTHRSPFGGRAAEYFSEDGLLAGYLGAEVISGAGDAGLYCAVKHLALMDSEGHRNPHTTVWLTEQALREVYLKPFELALKNAVKTVRYIDDETGGQRSVSIPAGGFVMTGDCAVGPNWSGANYALLTRVVRGEWGFRGAIISDMNLNSNPSRVSAMVRAGSDCLMSLPSGKKATFEELDTPTGMSLIRRAVKNLCYTVVNSNVMQGAAPGSLIRYAISPWKIGLAVYNGVALLLLLAGGVWLAFRGRSSPISRPTRPDF